MPFTFRAFFQGLAAAAPNVVELMQQDEERKIQNRKLGLEAAGLDIQRQQVDIQGKAYNQSVKAYEEVTKPAAQEQIKASQQSREINTQEADQRKSAAALANERARIENDIALNNKKLSDELAKYSPQMAKLEFEKMQKEVQRLTSQIAADSAAAEASHLLAQKYGYELADAKFSFKTKMAGVSAGIAKSPELQEFFAKEFDTPEAAMSALTEINIDPATKSMLLGTTQSVVEWMRRASDEKARILAQAAAAKMPTKQIKALTDMIDQGNASAVYGMLVTYGIPDLYPTLGLRFNPDGTLSNPNAEGKGKGKGQQPSGSGFNFNEKVNPLAGRTAQPTSMSDIKGSIQGAGRSVSSIYNDTIGSIPRPSFQPIGGGPATINQIPR